MSLGTRGCEHVLLNPAVGLGRGFWSCGGTCGPCWAGRYGSCSPWGISGDPIPTESVALASGNVMAALLVNRRVEWPVASRTSRVLGQRRGGAAWGLLRG